MSIRSVDVIESSVQKTNEWMKEVAETLGTNRESAWRVLRGYLQVIRDQLNIDEAAQLSAQLPLVLRGAFWEGFDPGDQAAKARHRDEFLESIAARAGLGHLDEAAAAAEAASRVLSSHITEGEFDDVLAQLPGEVREVLAH
jgi:uncharacterized protein (DUF2267 family)